jgi:hypothetical protein
VTPAGLRKVLEEAAAHAGVSGSVEPYGESSVIRGRVAGRGCDIGLGQRLFWVVVDTSWDLPERSSVLWAPEGSYERARSVQEDGPFAPSGDAAFDAVYLVGGEDASICAGRLSESGRRALCAAAWVRPGISWLDLAPPRRRRNVCATPLARAAGGSKQGTVTAPYVAKCVTAMLDVANGLER